MGQPSPLRGSLIALALVLAGAGCIRRFPPEPRPGEPTATLISVPFEEADTAECGPASLAMLLRWSNVDTGVAALAPEVIATERGGALRLSLIASARRHGRLAYPIAGADELLRELQAGHPVLVMQNLGLAWLPYWHYAVAIGYDRSREIVVLHTGRDRAREVAFSTFDRTWERAERWGLLVLPPSQLPETATELRLLDAAVGLERAGQSAAAVAAYTAVLRHWPRSLGAWIGLGNARFAGGDLAAAEQAFGRALELYPDSAAARINLAHVRASRGR